MTDLDTLARDASRELLERTAPEVRSRYAELRRVRAQRTTAKVAAVAAVAGLAIGGWQLRGVREQPIEPASQPGTVRNGVLLGLPAHDEDRAAAWRAINGEQPAHLPVDAAESAHYQFTSSGDEVVYVDRWAGISAVELATGNKRRLADCLDDTCLAALSPSGRTIASTDGERVRLQSVNSDAVTNIPAPGAGLGGTPAWSPDGTALAFAGAEGLYVVTVSSGEVRLAASSPLSGTVTGPVSWSPTSGAVAYLVRKPQQVEGYEQSAFTATVVDLATGTVTPLLDAGHCFCAGLPAPYLTWSPDGTFIAVATTTDSSERSWGVYLVHPDGSDPERVKIGLYAALAWQPITQ